MRTTPSVLVAGVGMLLAALPALAHHTMAEFDVSKPITLKGTFTRMEWVNPHGLIHIDVKGPDGKVVTWAIETGTPAALSRYGWARNSLPVGKEILVEGFRARDGTSRASGSRVTFPDGQTLRCGGHAPAQEGPNCR